MKSSTKTIIALFIFVTLLVSGRLLWHSHFFQNTPTVIVDGVANFKDWTFNSQKTFYLDGEWDFYPNELLTQKEIQSGRYQATQINVPSNWGSVLNPNTDSTYGSGTYHLKILLPSHVTDVLSLNVTSLRSSSTLYINDVLKLQQGVVSKEEEIYRPENLPKIVSFKVDGVDSIDLIIQIANFKDKRGAGIVRSIQFGTFEGIQKNVTLSSSLQIITGSFFYLLAILAVLLRIFSMPDKRLIHFAIVLVSSATVLLMSSEQKVLYYWIELPYSLSFRLVNLLLLTISFSLFTVAIQTYSSKNKKYFSIFYVFMFLLFLFGLLAPLPTLTVSSDIFAALLAVIIFFSLFLFFKEASLNRELDILLIFALLSFTNHFFWWGYSIQTGVTLPHYPFDLLLAIILIVMTWFKYYMHLYEDAIRLTTALKQSDQFKDDLISATSNKLKDPLQMMIHLTDAVLTSEENLSTRSTMDLNIARNTGERLTIVLNDLVDFIQLKNKTATLQLKPTLIQNKIQAVYDLLAFSMEQKNIIFTNNIPVNFPTIYADPQRVIQILYNLLHNASKFTNEGFITVDAKTENGKAYITITDTGCGMTEQVQQELLKSYERVIDKNGIIESHFGLGLATCRSLMDYHDGSLYIQSEEGKGTSITIDFHLFNEMNTLSTHKQSSNSSIPIKDGMYKDKSSEALNSKVMKVLIVENDPLHLLVLKRLLEQQEYFIQSTNNGRQALQYIQNESWDLVISDILLAEMSGYELTRKIRKNYSLGQLPILLIMARNLPQDIQESFRSGANDYVTKPFDALELRARVQALITTKQSIETSIAMEAAWLQAQIQPHFFFNTLNTILALQTFDEDKMQDVLEAFMNVLHSKFKFKSGTTPIPLNEELQLVRSYATIEKERFGDKLDILFDFERCNIETVQILPLTIQPLVENAIRHGVMQKLEGGTIRISGYSQSDQTIITIEDDGVGMSTETIQHLLNDAHSSNYGIGFVNTHIRLKKFCGQGLHIESAINQGTKIQITLPH